MTTNNEGPVFGVFPFGLHGFVVKEGSEDARGHVTFPFPWKKEDARVIVVDKELAETHANRLRSGA